MGTKRIDQLTADPSPTADDLVPFWEVSGGTTRRCTVAQLVTAGGGGSGVSDHAALSNLGFAASGHTGFAGTGVANTFTASQTITSGTLPLLAEATADVSALYVRGSQGGTAPIQAWYVKVGAGLYLLRASVGADGTITTTGGFSGPGASLTALNATNVSSGTLADGRLSSNVPLKDSANTFTGANQFGNAGNTFVGDGSGLTGLPPPAGVALLAAANTFTTGPQVLSGGVTVRQSGGVAGTDEGTILHDGSNFVVDAAGGEVRLSAQGTVRLRVNSSDVVVPANIFPTPDLTRDFGNSTEQWRDCFFRRAVMDTANASIRMTDVQLQRADTNCFKINDVAGSTGGILEFLQVSAGGTPTTNSARIYSKDVAGTAEVFVKDEAGNETQISAHNARAPASLYDKPGDPFVDPLPHVIEELNHYLGGVRYLNLSRACYLLEELLKAFRDGRTHAQIVTALQNKAPAFINVFHQESFAEHNARLGLTGNKALVKLDWDAEQQKLQDAYDAARAAEQAIHDEWVAAGSVPPEPPVRPAADVTKPKPAWLASRGA